jgi:dihydropyrimidinase
MKTLISGGTIVTAGDTYTADLLIDGERIALIGPDLAAHVQADKTVDASGKYIMPGGIDVHTHLDLPFGGTVSSDDFYTGHVAAAFGGTTCHVDFAIQGKGESLHQAIMNWHERADGKAVLDHGFHVAITDLNDHVMQEIGRLHDYGVSSIKLFLAYKGLFQVDDTTLFQAFLKASESGVITMIHAENGDVIDILVKKAIAEGHFEPVWHALTRPPQAEAEATNRAVQLASVAGAPVYIVHLTQRDALGAVARAKAAGALAYAETCPQYLFFTKDDLARPDFEGAKWVCSPPMREQEDNQALWGGLQNGALDAVSTDHCPFFFKGQKDLGRERFDKIPNGVPAIEDRLPVLYQSGVQEGRISLNRFVELTSTNPAKLFGMYPHKGAILPGSDADLAVWDPGRSHVRSAKTHHMNVDYNLWEGMEIQATPTQVFSRGRLLVDGDQFLGEKGSGKFLERGTPMTL